MDPMISWIELLLFVESCKSHNLDRIVVMLQQQKAIRIAQANSLEKAITGLTAKYGEEDSND